MRVKCYSAHKSNHISQLLLVLLLYMKLQREIGPQESAGFVHLKRKGDAGPSFKWSYVIMHFIINCYPNGTRKSNQLSVGQTNRAKLFQLL